MTAKSKTPLGGFPYAKPRTLAELTSNIKVARVRLEGCMAERSRIWLECMACVRDEKLQRVVALRDKADEQGRWALSLEAKIVGWERAADAIANKGMTKATDSGRVGR